MNKQIERIKKVLDNVGKLDDEDLVEEIAEWLSGCLDDYLDELKQDDAFGTEAQCDPRGDFRDEEWSMWNVQGVDG